MGKKSEIIIKVISDDKNEVKRIGEFIQKNYGDEITFRIDTVQVRKEKTTRGGLEVVDIPQISLIIEAIHTMITLTLLLHEYQIKRRVTVEISSPKTGKRATLTPSDTKRSATKKAKTVFPKESILKRILGLS
jgi:hypothetical protein